MRMPNGQAHFLIILACFGLQLDGYAGFTPVEVDQLLSCYSRVSKGLEGRAKYDFGFKGIEPKDFYKLFIDKARLAKRNPDEEGVPAHLMFDVKEPGYYDSMMKAFGEMSLTMGQPLTVSTIIDIHDIAIGGVKNIKSEKGLADRGQNFPLDSSTDKLDFEALEELVLSGFLHSHSAYMNLLSPHNSCGLHFSGPYSDLFKNDEFPAQVQITGQSVIPNASADLQTVSQKLAPFLAHFNWNISKLKTLDGKLEAIVELLRILEMSHLFTDGNQRTYAFVLLNKLLVENGIPPAILDSPFMFDGYYTVKDMARKVKQGVANFLNETEAAQRTLLVQDCRSEMRNAALEGKTHEKKDQIDALYLKNKSDYKPYFSLGKGFDKEIASKQKQIRLEVQSSIARRDFLTPDANGWTPMFKAVLIGNQVQAQILMNEGAYGSTDPILMAMDLGNLELFKTLWDRRPPDLKGGKKFYPKDPLAFAASHGLRDAFRYMISKLPREKILERDPNYGRSLADLAAEMGRIEILEELNARPDLRGLLTEQGQNKKTPLHSAIFSGNMRSIRYLVANVDPKSLSLKDDEDSTALHSAILNLHILENKVETVRLLAARMRKEDLNIRGSKSWGKPVNKTALELAKDHGEVQKILKEAGAE